MTVYSMTGYASALGQGSSGAAISVEMRSVNSRFLDLAFKLPDDWRGLEPALREQLQAQLKRGKIELRAAFQSDAQETLPQPTSEQLNALSRMEASVQAWLPQARALSVHEALQWTRADRATTADDALVRELALQCLQALKTAREREGAKLVTVLRERVALLRRLADRAEPLLPEVVARQQQRFIERWNEALRSAGSAANVGVQAQQERALGEAAAFAIRIDVAEELARLRTHLEEIERLLAKGGELGKRLDFLIQELHREANTLGSKSASIELTNLSVDMRVAIEQMREQVQNIE
jgi:uncharacterized protein (TIGR00255 family)